MKILREVNQETDITCLDRVWSEPATFAFVPKRSKVHDTWLSRALNKLPKPMRKNHFALLTTGSTGHPKLVIGSRSRAKGLASVLHSVQDNEPAECAVLVLPLSYCYAFVNQWLWSRCLGRRLVPTRGFAAPDELRTVLEATRNAMLCMVGAQLPLALQCFPDVQFRGVVRLHFAGDRFPQERLPEIRRMFPNASVFNNYGCAEAMPRLTVRPAEASNDAANIGSPLPGVELRTGPNDELMFRSPYGAVATVDDKGLHIIGEEDWVETGDLGRAGTGNQWSLLGRTSEVFKRYGEKVSLGQLLTTVHDCWDGQAAFFCEADPSGEMGAVLVLAPEPSDKTIRHILQGFRRNHSRTHWPLRIEGISSLPVLPNGKADLEGLAAYSGRTVYWKQRL